MPTLYPEIYIPRLKKTNIAIAARMGILHSNEGNIVEQLRDLVRLGLNARFFHNLPPNSGNNQIIGKLESIGGITPVRISDHVDFYSASLEKHLSPESDANKLIFLERNYIEKPDGRRLNLISVGNGGVQSRYTLEQLVQNARLRIAVTLMQQAVVDKKISRIHILRADQKDAIKNELLSLEGAGTLIENNFTPTVHSANEGDIESIFRLFRAHKNSGQLKPRSRDYVTIHLSRFMVAELDTIPVGCVEIIPIDGDTIELGGIAVNSYFMDFKVGKSLIEAVEKYAYQNNKNIISVTGNSKLEAIFAGRGYVRGEGSFPDRAGESPKKMLFYKKLIV